MDLLTEHFGIASFPRRSTARRPPLTADTQVYSPLEKKFFPLKCLKKEEEFLLPGEDGCPEFNFPWRKGDIGYYLHKVSEAWIMVRLSRASGASFLLFEDSCGTTYYFPTHKVPIVYLAG